jgi:endonuclease/exonuclease/phosphatase family metal-dependent hydrolase
VRLATWNILNGRSPADGRVDLERFAAAVASLDADVLGLQEVDRHQPRSGYADLAEVAAEAMGAVDHLFLPALRGLPGSWTPAGLDDPAPADNPGDDPAGDDAPAYGIALISRHPFVHRQMVSLGPAPPSWTRDQPRVAAIATVRTPGGELTVANTHLSFHPWWSGGQLRRLVTRLTACGRPLVLMGDLNMRPRRAAAITGMRPLAAGPTYSASRPARQIDHILVDGGLHATSGGAVTLALSDHRALVADLG